MIKSSKQSGAVKIKQAYDVSDKEMKLMAQVCQLRPELEIIGVDIAVLGNGDLRVIEVNRSPQFLKFYQLTGINLIKVWEELYGKKK